MNFFNELNNFLFPKEEPTKLELSPEEVRGIVNKLLSKYGSAECLVFVLLGAYFGATNTTKDNVMQRVKVLTDVNQDNIIRFNLALKTEPNALRNWLEGEDSQGHPQSRGNVTLRDAESNGN